jgi:large subunit ribosomal protein L23
MRMDPHQIIKNPIITEETQIQTGKGNQYTFKVNPKANKSQIRGAIESIFPGVQVVRVNTMNYKGKLRRVMTSRRAGYKASWKKAIVTLRAGDSIDLI